MVRPRTDTTCSIARSLEVLGERWTFLILREAFNGVTRFVDFREELGIAPDVLSARLATLVECGVMTRQPYREPGSRSRFSYHLTDAGRDLNVILGALMQWGDEHLPHPDGPTVRMRSRTTGRSLHVDYVDEADHPVDREDVAFARTTAFPSR